MKTEALMMAGGALPRMKTTKRMNSAKLDFQMIFEGNYAILAARILFILFLFSFFFSFFSFYFFFFQKLKF